MKYIRKILNRNNVGAGFHPCPENGITLLALVITIVIMLILASVTVNVVIDGGLFEYAGNAKSEVKKTEYKEELQKIIMLSNNFTEIKTKCIKSNIFEGAEYTQYENDKILIVKTQEDYEFMVKKDEVTQIKYINIEDGSITIYPDYYIQNEVKTNYSGKNFFITGTTTTNTVTIAGDATNTYNIYMYNLSVQVNSIANTCAFNISEGANVNIELMQTNTLISGTNCAGLQKSSTNGTLTINGSGNLTSYGGTYSAGIGGGYNANVASCTNIVINGGTIIAESGNLGSGIGAGNNISAIVDNIIINGGTISAKGNNAGIGTSRRGASCSNIIINGGNVTVYSWYESCGIGGDNLNNVKITGGTVNIYTNNKLPAIGIKATGETGVDNIIITGGNTKLTSKGSILIGTSDQGIPPTDEDENEVVCTTITLSGITSETKISNIVFSNYEGEYGTKDMYTYSDGKVYLWLPEGAKVVSITAGDKTYTAESPILAGTTGTFN